MKRRKILVYVILSLLIVGGLLFGFNNDTHDAFPNIVTFISINIGFCITALSIISNSSFSKKLYDIEDSKDNSKTLLHILINKFKEAMVLFIITVACVLIYYFLEKNPFYFWLFKHHFSSTQLAQAFIWNFTIFSFYEIVSVINLLSKFIVRF